MELNAWIIAAIMVVSFLCEYMDSSLGMGFGTTLTPVLMLVGFSPMEIVPAVLVSELFSGLAAAVFHHRQGNVNLQPRNKAILHLAGLKHPGLYLQQARKSLPMDLKIAILFILCSTIGAAAAVYVALHISKFWLKMYIGIVVLAMGLVILVFLNRRFKFSVWKISTIGVLAAFNKAISGGGYGPLVTAGQILSGVQGKNAVGITSLAEGVTCLIGVVGYLLAGANLVSFRLAPYVVFGAILSVPLAARSVKLIPEKILKLCIAGLSIILGSLTLIKTLQAG